MSDEEINLDLLSLLTISQDKLLKKSNDRKQISLLTAWYNQLEMEIFELSQLKPTDDINKSRDYKLGLLKSIEEKIKSINQ